MADLLKADPESSWSVTPATRTCPMPTTWILGRLRFLPDVRAVEARYSRAGCVCAFLTRMAEPLEAFSKLIGEPLPVFEESFHRYLRMLRPDGSTAN